MSSVIWNEYTYLQGRHLEGGGGLGGFWTPKVLRFIFFHVNLNCDVT